MKRFANMPAITSREEVTRTLCLYCDLSKDAQEAVFSRYDNESDADFHMQTVYEELYDASRFFERETGFSVKLESVHGPGTEMYFPDYGPWNARAETLYYSNGPETVESISDAHLMMCYEYSVADAWNAYVSRINGIAHRCQELEELAYDDASYAAELLTAQTEYMDTLEEAIQAVCDTLNQIESTELDYVQSKEFFEYEYLDISDSEHWFTPDGMREYVRDSRGIENMDDPFFEVYEIYEGNGRLMILEVSES